MIIWRKQTTCHMKHWSSSFFSILAEIVVPEELCKWRDLLQSFFFFFSLFRFWNDEIKLDKFPLKWLNRNVGLFCSFVRINPCRFAMLVPFHSVKMIKSKNVLNMNFYQIDLIRLCTKRIQWIYNWTIFKEKKTFYEPPIRWVRGHTYSTYIVIGKWNFIHLFSMFISNEFIINLLFFSSISCCHCTFAWVQVNRSKWFFRELQVLFSAILWDEQFLKYSFAHWNYYLKSLSNNLTIPLRYSTIFQLPAKKKLIRIFKPPHIHP